MKLLAKMGQNRSNMHEISSPKFLRYLTDPLKVSYPLDEFSRDGLPWVSHEAVSYQKSVGGNSD